MVRSSRRTDAQVPVPSTTEEFLEALEHAGGELRVTSPSDDVRAAWRRVIHRVRQGKHVPEGWHLLHRGRDSGDLVIEMRRGEHPADKYRRPEGEPVRIPAELTKPHPVARALRGAPERLPASQANRGRAVMIAHALAEEAERRGLTVVTGTGDVILQVQALDTRYAVRMNEESGARWNLRLVLEIEGPGAAASNRWCDRASWHIEDALGQVLDEIIRWAEAARRGTEEKERRETERKAAERARAIREHRGQILRAQVAAWREAERIRQHCDQLVAAGMPEQDEWVTWARARADEIDPLTDPPGMPPPPTGQPTQQRLAPVLESRVKLPEANPWHPNRKWWAS